MCEDEETPKCKKSKMDKEKSKPTLAQPSTAEKDPNWTRLRRGDRNPRYATSNTSENAPGHVEPLESTELPKCKRSDATGDGPRRAHPNKLHDDTKRLEL